MRHEFTITVKRAALERSGGRCEAVGERYGLPSGVQCQRAIYKGRVHFDHFPRGAHDPHPDTRTIGNCVATCPECNMYAARHFDVQTEQAIKRKSYDEQLHQARMQRKAGIDVPDPIKPRGRKRPKTRMKSRTNWPPKGARKIQQRVT